MARVGWVWGKQKCLVVGEEGAKVGKFSKRAEREKQDATFHCETRNLSPFTRLGQSLLPFFTHTSGHIHSKFL